jgi:acetylornithine deacetylase
MATVSTSDVVELTAALVGLDTVSDRSNLQLLDAVEERLRDGSSAWRFERRRYTGRSGNEQANLIARLPGSLDAPGLVLGGHADTVPWQPGTRATVAASQEAGVLWGRGTCDMKGAIAAMLVAAGAAARSDDALRLPLTLLVTAEEELGCLGAKRLLADGDLRGRMAIIGEPTSLRPVRMHKGYLGADVEVHGHACHGSRPDLGESALFPAARATLALRELGRTLEREGLSYSTEAGAASLWTPPYASLNVGVFQAGIARNVVPAEARFTVSVRPLPGNDMDELRRRVERAVAESTGPGIRVELVWTTTDPPMRTPPDAEVTRLAEELTGKTAGAVCFSTEGKELNALGIPSIICGPGTIDVAHTDDEHVPLDELEAAVDLYRRAIDAVCG